MADARPTRHFDALAGLRGIAAIAVVLWHGYDLLGVPRPPAAYLAVDFFFLLSGWVLAHAYDQRLAAGLSATDFLRQRLVRLYPVYLPALLLGLAAALVDGHGQPFAWFLVSLLLLPEFWAPAGHWLVSPAWSLAAELVANISFALFHRRLGGRVLLAVIAIAGLLLIATALRGGNLNQGATVETWTAMLPRVFFSFPLGVLLYRHRARLGRWAPGWSGWPSFLLLPALLAIPAPGNEAIRDVLIMALALPALLLFAAGATPGAPTARLAAGLGALSYPLYLLHRPLLLLTADFAGAGPTRLPALAAIGFVALLLLLALAVDRWYDRPVRQWLLSGARVPGGPRQRQIAP